MHLRARVFFVVALLVCSQASGQTTFSNFCDTSAFTLNGSTGGLNPNGDCALRLTSGLGQSGSAFLTNTISLAADASFSTFFRFQISNPVGIGDGDGQGADGLVFVVQTVANNVGGSGGGIGYAGIADSVGIEFDTFDNGGGFGDPDGNHVGIDLEGNIASVQAQPVATRLNNGEIWFAWVDYNGATDNLEVRLSDTAARPAAPLMTRSVDLAAVLGQTNAFIGFTSGTGAGANTHDILSWQFNAAFAPIDGNNTVTATKTADPSTVSVGNNVTFTIVVTNPGDTPATNVTVSDPLPSSLTFVSASATQGSCSGTSTVNCSLGTLAPSASATITITARADSTGSTSNVATVQVNGSPIGAPATTNISIEGPAIPTVSQWALLMLAALLAGAALITLRS